MNHMFSLSCTGINTATPVCSHAFLAVGWIELHYNPTVSNTLILLSHHIHVQALLINLHTTCVQLSTSDYW